MATVINGTDNTAATPALTGTDTDTGVFFPAANTMALSTGGTEAMRIDSAGNLGLSVTPSPWGLLKALQIQNASFAGLSNTTYVGSNVYFDGSNFKYISTAASTLYTLNNTAGQHQWSTAASGTAGTNITYNQAMTLDASGNLLVNRTSGIYSDAKFEIKGSASATAACLQIGTNGFAAWSWRNDTGSEVGFISINVGSTAYSTSSDYRLKENITPMTGALATVAALKPVTYNWKIDGSAGQGFIAHELQEVVPECVVGEKDAVNEDGSIKAQGIDTSFLVATLTAALQEAHGLIKDLQVRVESLESK
jgi:hypothetical protein